MLGIILGDDPSKLISLLYYTIRQRGVAAASHKAKTQWEQDIGPIDDADWNEILEGTKTVSPKMLDRLTQIYIVHKAYLTPLRLARFQHTPDPTCRLCRADPGSFYHLIWSCPVVQTFWAQVIRFLHDNMGSPVVLDPKLCILGLLPDVEVDKYHTIFISETIFLERKVIAQRWMQNVPPHDTDVEKSNKRYPTIEETDLCTQGIFAKIF